LVNKCGVAIKAATAQSGNVVSSKARAGFTSDLPAQQFISSLRHGLTLKYNCNS